eukprot:6802717-Pyramimonas_sp.AAC.1
MCIRDSRPQATTSAALREFASGLRLGFFGTHSDWRQVPLVPPYHGVRRGYRACEEDVWRHEPVSQTSCYFGRSHADAMPNQFMRLQLIH